MSPMKLLPALLLVVQASSPLVTAASAGSQGIPTCFGKAATKVGTAAADSLTGTSGADVIVGRGGNDTISGAGGADRICGGPGNDVLRGKGGYDSLNGGDGTDTCYPGDGGGKKVSCEKPSTGDGGGDCTAGYSPCIPTGSDVDCAGGTGNGPRYVDGPVYVTGSDPYGLDADGDGVGCE
jgi:hemolysin type calcium-binding protein